MVRFTTSYVCQQCGYVSPTFLGRCPECDNWNTFVEQVEEVGGARNKELRVKREKAEIINLEDIEKVKYKRLDTKIGEFNRVLGGGVVLGSLVLVSGDPGIGKSTLLTQLALNVKELGTNGSTSRNLERSTPPSSSSLAPSSCLYVAGEESPQQIKLRADRINPNAKLPVINETDVDVIIGAAEEFRSTLIIVDSIQALETQDLESAPGSIAQVRECAHRLQRLAKKLHIPIFLVGHVTKEGNIAGPKTLEHLVDVVLSLEGESTSQFRILRVTKNRFGPTDEVGVFEMEESGMVEVKNPSKVFLEEKVDAPGSAVVSTLTGLRPILVEIQALVTRSNLAIPRRTGSGIDNNRLQLIVAVLQKRLGLSLFDQDVFVNVTGGFKLTEPAVDLGIAMAIISSLKDQIISSGTVLIGEVGLLGELRAVRGLDKRVLEAKKLGYDNVISSERAKTLKDVTKLVFK